MSVSLPEPLKDFVKERSERGLYGTPSDYIRALIREDLKRHEQEKLEALLLDGLASGEPQSMTKDNWEALRADVHKRIAERKRGR